MISSQARYKYTIPKESDINGQKHNFDSTEFNAVCVCMCVIVLCVGYNFTPFNILRLNANVTPLPNSRYS